MTLRCARKTRIAASGATLALTLLVWLGGFGGLAACGNHIRAAQGESREESARMTRSKARLAPGPGAQDATTPQDGKKPGAAQSAAALGLLFFERGEMQMLPPVTLESKMQSVFPGEAGRATSARMRGLGGSLGYHDFAQGVHPNLQWSAERMEAWLRVAAPTCEDAEFHRGSAGASGRKSFLERAYGRSLRTEDETVLARITALDGRSDSDKSRLLCQTVLLSAEFVSL